jgi:hypothetical protein
MLPSELLVLAFGIPVGYAMSVPLQRLRRSTQSLHVSTLCDWSSDPYKFTSVDGLAYTVTLDVAGQPFSVGLEFGYVRCYLNSFRSYQVQLDTGSSDLWFDTAHTNLTNAAATGRNASITYAWVLMGICLCPVLRAEWYLSLQELNGCCWSG